MALRSAWELHRYLAPVSRQCLASTSSRTPRGKPLKPVDLISLSGPTMTAPTRRPFSLLQRAISCASSMNLSSQALENIANQVLRSARLIKTRSGKEASDSNPLPNLPRSQGRFPFILPLLAGEDREGLA